MYQQRQIRIGGPLTPVVKSLLIINLAVYVIKLILDNFIDTSMLFGLSYSGFFKEGFIWQIATYMFPHANFLHVFLNCIAIWMFAGELEDLWGSKFFLSYYIFSGIGAGFFILLLSYFTNSAIPTIGASGAIYALLLAYGINWPNREVLIYFILPVKMKYLVLIFGLLEFFGTVGSLNGINGNISHIGHLGGLISGFLILWFAAKSRKEGKSFKTRNRRNERSFIEKFIQKQKNKSTRERIETRIKAQKTIDLLLAKIASTGLESLTAEEKRDLEWARKNYYPTNEDIIH